MCVLTYHGRELYVFADMFIWNLVDIAAGWFYSILGFSSCIHGDNNDSLASPKNDLASLAGLPTLLRSRRSNAPNDEPKSPYKKQKLADFATKNGKPEEYKYDCNRSFVEKPSLRSFDMYGFNSFTTIRDFINGLNKEKPDLVRVMNIGRSSEGRLLQVVKISTDLAKEKSYNNPAIFILAGTHARDWFATAMALYMIQRLTSDAVALERELDGVDWYIMPLANPDGYEYSRRKNANRLWKKTRSKRHPRCAGVDGDRNYGFSWSDNGISDPCSDNYGGTKPFTENETAAVRDFLTLKKKYIKLFVSLNCYGQYLVYPWSYTAETKVPTWRRLRNLANMVSDAVQMAGGPPFKVMSAGSRSEVAGSSIDYAFGSIEIPYVYEMELSEGFDYAFPENLLKNVLNQYYEGFLIFVVQIQKEYSEYYDEEVEQS